MQKFSTFFLLLILLNLLNNSDACYEVFEEDLELSKKIPIISGIDSDSIFKGNKAAITLCTIPLNSFIDHISLVFEIKHPVKNEINLFSVHYGGDGLSFNQKKRPTIDSAQDTLIKVFRGKEVTLSNINTVGPVYTKKVVFIVEKDQAIEAIKNVESDNNLTYSLPGWSYSFLGYKSHNCCTYVIKVLKDAGIDIGLNTYYVLPKTAGQLIDYAWSCNISSNPNNERRSPNFNLKDAKFILGMMYYKGDNVEKDVEAAIKWLKKAAEEQHPNALFNLATIYYKGKDIEKNLKIAVECFEKAAEQEETALDAQFFLGNIYYEGGEGVEKNLEVSAKWLKKVTEKAEQKNAIFTFNLADAQFILGSIYYKGEGVEKNLKIAREWYRKAIKSAEQKDAIFTFNLADTQFTLGSLYEKNGIFPNKSEKAALKWYKKAAEQGHEEAKLKLEKLNN